MRGSRLAALAGLAGAALWIALAFFPPAGDRRGTPEYEQYLLWNRLWSPALVLMALAFAAAATSSVAGGSRLARRSLLALVVAIGVMMAGNIAEFWFLMDLSHSGGGDGPKLRGLAWMAFLLGWLGALVAGTAAGVALLRTGGRAVAAWPLALVLILTIGIGAAGSMNYAGMPLAVAVIGVAIALLLDRGTPVRA